MDINISSCHRFISHQDTETIKLQAVKKLESIQAKTCYGNDFLGWMALPDIDEQALLQIEETAKNIQNFETVVVIGIGGSYLGAKALIDLFTPYFEAPKTEVIFAGHHLDDQYLLELLQHLKGKDFALIPISKSGTTLEPAVAFRFLLEQLIRQFGEHTVAERVFPITDKNKGALRTLVEQYSLKSFVVPDDVGGRFSVLSPVGLLPIAIAGVNIRALLEGAKEGMSEYIQTKPDNQAVEYATVRNLLYQKGYVNELMVYSKPKFNAFAEWWKQLFGESEGKSHKGIFPAALQVTTDLHSLGQFVQDGTRCLFETWIKFNQFEVDIQIPRNEQNLDQLNYLTGKSLHEINSKAETGTIEAHQDGAVPIVEINIDQCSEFHIGKLIAFYEVACAISALLNDINPFDQPGVETYKQKMFKLLGK